MVRVPIPTRCPNRLISFSRDKRIFSTGCAGESRSSRPSFLVIDTDDNTVENTKMNDCYYEKKDWRLCKSEVRSASFPILAIFLQYHVQPTSGNFC